MELPGSKTPIGKSLKLGRYTARMLGKFPQSAVLTALAAKMSAATSTLDAKQTAYAAAILAIVDHRVDVRHADWRADAGVRKALRVAELADGGEAGGPFASHLFPGGITPIIKPVGDTQIVAMSDLEGRYEGLKDRWDAALAEKATIEALRVDYETALKGRRQAGLTAGARRAERDLAKEDFLDVIAAIAGAIKQEHPRNRPLQDLFFDEVSAKAAGSSDDDDEGDDAPSAPSGEATPSGGEGGAAGGTGAPT